MISIKIQNKQVKRVSKDLDQWGAEVRKDVIDAVNATALTIESKAKRNSPVDTGRLRAGNRSKLYRGN